MKAAVYTDEKRWGTDNDLRPNRFSGFIDYVLVGTIIACCLE